MSETSRRVPAAAEAGHLGAAVGRGLPNPVIPQLISNAGAWMQTVGAQWACSYASPTPPC